MAEPAVRPAPPLYDRDFYAWSEEQSRLLMARSRAGLDWDNLAEEIATLGRSERSEIRSRIRVILVHLLKWQFQPEGRNASWAGTLLEQRDQLNETINASPSLRGYPQSILPRQYDIARLKAAGETGLPVENFPQECPYTAADILDDTFFPAG